MNPLEGLTDTEIAHGGDYVTVMDQNLAKIRRALGCTRRSWSMMVARSVHKRGKGGLPLW